MDANPMAGALPSDELEVLREKIGHAFADPELLLLALTHASVRIEAGGCNERLEHLGDAVLSVVVAEDAYHRFPDAHEGTLTTRKAKVVRDSTLAEVFAELELVPHLRTAQSVQLRPGELPPPSILGGAFEAIVGALFLDGGLDAARTFVLAVLESRIAATEQGSPLDNPKTYLQHIAQVHLGQEPVYRIRDLGGSAHLPTFEVAVLVDGDEIGRGLGRSKKAATRQAARSAVARLRHRGIPPSAHEPTSSHPDR